MVKKSVLFVSKSALLIAKTADYVFKQVIEKLGQEDKWTVENASLVPTDPFDVANQLPIFGHRNRMINIQDFHQFDFILIMEPSDLIVLRSMAPLNYKAKIKLIGDFHPSGQLVFDDANKIFDAEESYSFGFQLTVNMFPCIMNFLTQNS